MARVTIEKCVKQFENRFELVYAMVQRVKEIEKGDPVKVRRRNHKNHVLALREVEEGMVDVPGLREKMIVAKQRYREKEEDALDKIFKDDEESNLMEQVASGRWKEMEIEDYTQFDSVSEEEIRKEEKE